ncbi:MAG: phospholipase D-like domain-containing protein [Bdellovibrionaceae bacterium]|nr:phospholipase D-like domain-containing protein [Pseudobdellovibrionaceae bacterium]NUM60441.1 hypothetical protein [Pseudobdellovibrionaceae bacterium]
MDKLLLERQCFLSQATWTDVDEFKVLIDAQDYYQSFYQHTLKARKKIVIVGWDVDSRTKLLPNTQLTLKQHLLQLVQNNCELNIYILCWDFSIFTSSEREWGPWLFGSKWHERIEFIMDHHHPLFSSQHQKIVTVDDQVVFVGGIDLCENRLDNSEHLKETSLRINSRGKSYKAFHDVQVLIRGKMAEPVIHIANQRWLQATKKDISLPFVTEPLDWETPGVVIGETASRLKGMVIETSPHKIKTKRKMDNLKATLELIKLARKYIYIENQYLTHRRVIKALGQKLTEGKIEITVVLPKKSFNWLENSTIHLVQRNALMKLREYDQYNKLKVVYPRIDYQDKSLLYVHSKLMIVDNIFFKVGSSNLNHRSMGLDSECDVLFFSKDQEGKIKKIFLCLVSEHLGLSSEIVEQFLLNNKSLHLLINSRKESERSLQEFPKEKIFLQNLWGIEPIFDRSSTVSWLKILEKPRSLLLGYR